MTFPGRLLSTRSGPVADRPSGERNGARVAGLAACIVLPAMDQRTFHRAVTVDESGFLDRLVALLEAERVRWCVVGGQAVNAYVDPVVSLDLDIALATGEPEQVAALFPPPIEVRRFPHSINLSAPGSDLRVQIQTDPRYDCFPERAEVRDVLGHPLPVARVEDVLQGKVWAAGDETRRPSKRQKDLADIARLLEAFPELRPTVPAAILDRLIA